MGLFTPYISSPYSGAKPTPQFICVALKTTYRKSTEKKFYDIFCFQRPVPISANQGPSKGVIPKPLLGARIRQQVTPASQDFHLPLLRQSPENSCCHIFISPKVTFSALSYLTWLASQYIPPHSIQPAQLSCQLLLIIKHRI